MEKLVKKIGYYAIFLNKNGGYVVDSGKTLKIVRFNKIIKNPYREQKIFKTLAEAEAYAFKRLEKAQKAKQKKLKTLPQFLYLIEMRELKSGNKFIKVGFTRKKFVSRRFSKEYGYDGYKIDIILRKIKYENAEILESKIKKTLNASASVKKYRPLMENFSGYSECYSFDCKEKIIEVFDFFTKGII